MTDGSAGIAGVKVLVFDNPNYPFTVAGSALTEANGDYTATDLPSGDYKDN